VDRDHGSQTVSTMTGSPDSSTGSVVARLSAIGFMALPLVTVSLLSDAFRLGLIPHDLQSRTDATRACLAARVDRVLDGPLPDSVAARDTAWLHKVRPDDLDEHDRGLLARAVMSVLASHANALEKSVRPPQSAQPPAVRSPRLLLAVGLTVGAMVIFPRFGISTDPTSATYLIIPIGITYILFRMKGKDRSVLEPPPIDERRGLTASAIWADKVADADPMPRVPLCMTLSDQP